jgi:hypothetical protein
MSNPAPALITCIYCKEERPPSREHILARNMGGDATRWIVCERCNKGLSAIDQALAQRSLVAISRVADTPAGAFDVALGGEHFHHDEARDLVTEVSLTNGLRPAPFPQLHFRIGTNNVMVVADDEAGLERLVAFVDKRLADGSLRELHVKVGPAEKCTTARIVVHRENDGFIRVAQRGHEVAVFDALEKAWGELRAKMTGGEAPVAESVPNPTVELTMHIRLDDVFRAVAKTAFNVLATDVGVAMARRPEFDPIREYICGRSIEHPEILEEGQVAVDPRFVRMVPFGETPLIPTDKHAVTISYQHPKLMAFVTLYKVHSFVVELATVELPDRVLASREFSTIRRGNAQLDLKTLYERLSLGKLLRTSTRTNAAIDEPEHR